MVDDVYKVGHRMVGGRLSAVESPNSNKV